MSKTDAWKLFWVAEKEPRMHEIDWFVVAASPEAAAEFVNKHDFGHGTKKLDVRLVTDLTKEAREALRTGDVASTSDEYFGYPSLRILELCGCVIEKREPPRLVRFKGRAFGEGTFPSRTRRDYEDGFATSDKRRGL